MAIRLVADWAEVPVVMDLPYAGRIVGKSPESLKKRAQKGDFPAFKEGAQWRVSKEALRAHLGLTPRSSGGGPEDGKR